jgi:branched-subunit amino acid transport protein
MSTHYILLAVLMLAVTYPARALPLLVPGAERLPAWARTYLRLVGPGVLAALAATGALVVTTPSGPAIEVGVTAASVLVCVAVVARRRTLLLGLALAVAFAALARAAGIG